MKAACTGALLVCIALAAADSVCSGACDLASEDQVPAAVLLQVRSQANRVAGDSGDDSLIADRNAAAIDALETWTRGLNVSELANNGTSLAQRNESTTKSRSLAQRNESATNSSTSTNATATAATASNASTGEEAAAAESKASANASDATTPEADVANVTTTACATRKDPRARQWFAQTAAKGTPCVFGADPDDEGSHCIFDDGDYGSNGWCWTKKDRSEWGSCNSHCPLWGQHKVLGDKIDEVSDTLDRIASKVAASDEASLAEDTEEA